MYNIETESGEFYNKLNNNRAYILYINDYINIVFFICMLHVCTKNMKIEINF